MPTLMAVVVFAVSVGSVVALSKRTDTVTRQRKTLAQLNADLANLDAIIVDEKTYADTMTRVRRSLPRGYAEVAHAIAVIEQVAKNSNITLDLRIDDTAKPEPNGIQSIGITMQTGGNFASTVAFFRAIALLPYHTQVDTMQIDGAGSKVTGTVGVRLFIGMAL